MHSGHLIAALRRLFAVSEAAELTDRHLLDRYATHRDEAAFAALLRRHGDMVWAVCRRELADVHDADEAFQATFLVLVHKAASLRGRESVAGWLQGVAWRLARKLKADAACRQVKEANANAGTTVDPLDEALRRDLRQVLDAELDRLPEKYRAPLILCYLEGQSYTEAARYLGWTEGTVSGRLARARELLRQRLTRRGLTLSSAALAAALAEQVKAPAGAVAAALRTAALFALGESALGTVPASIATLAKGVLHTMAVTKLKTAIALIMALCALTGSASWVTYRAAARQVQQEVESQPTNQKSEAKPGVEKQQARSDRDADPLRDQVKRAIDRGVQFLKDQERGRGNWEVSVDGTVLDRTVGWTALSLLALLNCGVPVDDPAVKRGLQYLRDIPPKQTYVVSLQTMVFALAGHGVDRERIQRNVDWLLAARLPNGWTYGKAVHVGSADNSNTQYALLGLHEGLRSGAKVPAKALEDLRDFYIRTQEHGCWSYNPVAGGGTMTMTTAGLCGLVITGMDLATGQQVLNADGSAENCGVYRENKPISDALDWIGRRFPARITDRNVQGIGSTFYSLYGIGRAGRLTGRRFFGEHDWYRVGCEFLVRIQRTNGSWVGDGQGHQFDFQPIIATSFSLLFLSKGRTPVLLTKVAHNEGDGWNNKCNDMRHLVEFASRELYKRQPLVWQLYDIRSMGALANEELNERARDLSSSPVVFFNGHDKAPTGRERELLQRYLAAGGVVFAEACCGYERFDRSFRDLVKQLFPKVTLHELPPNHPVWKASGKFVSASGAPFKLYGVDKGGRTVLIYSPAALAGYWEANQWQQGRGKAAFELAANIIAYATGGKPPVAR